MDITNFVVQGRDKALLYGDYSTYHGLLSKRLLNCRKKLGLATKNRGKFHPKNNVTPDEVAQSHGYVQLLLLTSERAWAQAMSIKSAHSTDQKGITGRTRSHIVSRLTKAARTADDLVDILSQSDISGANSTDILEAKAYAALIRGAMLFEKQSWEPSLRSYATARIVYSALATTTKGDIFKDLLSETIDPSIRYSAYQLNTPRTVPIPVIAQRAFPHSDAALVKEIDRIDTNLLKQGETDLKKEAPGAEDAPKTLTWRSREVIIEDAQIAVAWGFVLASKERLATTLAEPKDRQPNDLSAAYDEILSATQDAVDATKQAIDEMRAEGIEQGDPRMQSLQITRTAVNFEMISWRIGRNRVLTGSHDGATEEYGPVRRRRAKVSEEPTKQEKELPTGKKLGKLKEKVALYAGILQSIDSIKELPGVANDQELADQIDSFVKYFAALKALSVARSHAIIGKCANTLGLIHHAFGLCGESLSKVPKSDEASTKGGPLSLNVEHEAVEFLHKLLDGERQRYRAIVHIDELRTDKKEDAEDDVKRPLVETLQDYPINGVELANIVEYPPKMALIPMKPIFLDVAWNYIEYPGKADAEREAPAKEGSAGTFGCSPPPPPSLTPPPPHTPPPTRASTALRVEKPSPRLKMPAVATPRPQRLQKPPSWAWPQFRHPAPATIIALALILLLAFVFLSILWQLAERHFARRRDPAALGLRPELEVETRQLLFNGRAAADERMPLRNPQTTRVRGSLYDTFQTPAPHAARLKFSRSMMELNGGNPLGSGEDKDGAKKAKTIHWHGVNRLNTAWAWML
ncbi:hypothetical protein AK830_g12036 [Neonectria ditissima]|uniref:Signal recognition particle subunit SRP68 n=1 Tax=Neonectria ditissima TaxID=78410 RepID=A0A0P7AKU4_9HYPO|nr:hypothetical protein AK830_g12036 [Neonectria ditissima]